MVCCPGPSHAKFHENRRLRWGMLQLANRPEGRGFSTQSSGCVLAGARQGQKNPPYVRPPFPIYSPGGHEVSRAERPSQPTTKGDGLSHFGNGVTYIRNRLARSPAKRSLGNDG